MTSEQISTRRRIVAESLRLFADKGYEATTLHEIAEAIGIKTASLYAHYTGKEAMFREVLETATTDWKDAVDAVFTAAQPIGSLEEGVSAILSGLMAAFSDSVSYRFWARIYVFPPPPVTRADLERFAEMDSGLSVRLEQYCAHRTPAGVPAESMSAFCSTLVNMVMGFLMNSPVMDPALIGAQIARNISFMLKALTA